MLRAGLLTLSVAAASAGAPALQPAVVTHEVEEASSSPHRQLPKAVRSPHGHSTLEASLVGVNVPPPMGVTASPPTTSPQYPSPPFPPPSPCPPPLFPPPDKQAPSPPPFHFKNLIEFVAAGTVETYTEEEKSRIGLTMGMLVLDDTSFAGGADKIEVTVKGGSILLQIDIELHNETVCDLLAVRLKRVMPTVDACSRALGITCQTMPRISKIITVGRFPYPPPPSPPPIDWFWTQQEIIALIVLLLLLLLCALLITLCCCCCCRKRELEDDYSTTPLGFVAAGGNAAGGALTSKQGTVVRNQGGVGKGLATDAGSRSLSGADGAGGYSWSYSYSYNAK